MANANCPLVSFQFRSRVGVRMRICSMFVSFRSIIEPFSHSRRGANFMGHACAIFVPLSHSPCNATSNFVNFRSFVHVRAARECDFRSISFPMSYSRSQCSANAQFMSWGLSIYLHRAHCRRKHLTCLIR